MIAQEKAEKLVKWLAKYHYEPTTVLVARLGLPRDFAHCCAIDTVRGRYTDRADAARTALCIADKILDESVFDHVDEPNLCDPAANR